MPHQISCQECGTSFPARYRNTKLCPECRIIRDLQHSRSAVKCELCSEPFFRIRLTHKFCYNCMLTLKDVSHIPCQICSRSISPAPGMQNVCLPCVSSTKARIDLYLKRLIERRNTILKES